MEQQTKGLPVFSSRRQEGESRERRYTKQENAKRIPPKMVVMVQNVLKV